MFFTDVEEAKPDPVFGMTGTFKKDPRKQKINLMVGIYHDEHLRTKLMSAVKKAKEEVDDLLATYLPMEGLASFCEKIGELVFGKTLWKEHFDRMFIAQTPGGTAALRVAAEFLGQEVNRLLYIPQPTWGNHSLVFGRAGCKVENYPYYSEKKHGFDFDAMCAFLEKVPEKSVIVLHAACHNPTGCDPTEKEWKALSQLMRKQKLFPFFDFAYQGFGEGLEKDAEAIRTFLKDGHEMAICYSCSKNFSLYCQRVGALLVVTENLANKERVGSQVKRIARALYSNPPAHGAKLALHVMDTPHLKKEWEQELTEMRNHLIQRRNEFVEVLVAKSKETRFNYLKKHKGMFSFIDLEKSQVQRLIDEFAIYMQGNGRINVAGLTKNNMDYVVESLLKVCE